MRSQNGALLPPAGALEQNGPFNVVGEHNYRLESMAPAIARRLGNALVAPIVRLSPSGDINPPTGHMQFAGTISLRQETYEALLTDMVSSLAQHGFKDIIQFGDSGGGEQTGMKAVSDQLNAQWRGTPAQVYFIPEFYTEDQYGCEYLKAELGIVQQPDRCSASPDLYHDSYEYEATVAVSDPTRIRPSQRRKAGLFSINGQHGALGEDAGQWAIAHRPSRGHHSARDQKGDGGPEEHFGELSAPFLDRSRRGWTAGQRLYAAARRLPIVPARLGRRVAPDLLTDVLRVERRGRPLSRPGPAVGGGGETSAGPTPSGAAERCSWAK